MIRNSSYAILSLFMAFSLSSCQSSEKPAVYNPALRQVQFQSIPEGGQLPANVLREASDRYGGSMPSEEKQNASGVVSGNTVVLGPLITETEGGQTSVTKDAGQKIREIIALGLTATDLTLIDAPEERYIDDSPRTDLAARGIRFVIKGLIDYSDSTGETIVFLRVIETRNGAVASVASGRSTEQEEAAREATGRLKEKLNEVL